MAATAFKYIFIKLNVNGIKKQNIDSYIATIMQSVQSSGLFNNCLIIPTTQSETRIKIVYQITDIDGRMILQEIDV